MIWKVSERNMVTHSNNAHVQIFVVCSPNWSKLKGAGVPATLQVLARPEKCFVIVIVP